MSPADEKVRGQSPVRQISKVRETLAGAAGSGVGIIPTEDDEDGGKGIEGEEEA